VNDPEFRQKRMISQGLEPYDSSQEAFAKLIREDTKQWQQVIELAPDSPEAKTARDYLAQLEGAAE